MSDEEELEAVVIQFHRKKPCFHNHLIVDDELQQIECKNCGEKLNPFYAIRRLMRLGPKWAKQKAEADLAREQAEKKCRTKCEHCKQMTRIRTDVRDFQVIDRMRENGEKV